MIVWGVDVINMSLQGLYDFNIANAVAQAWNADIVIVAAAGNVPVTSPGTVVYPAGYAQVIGVSGIDENNQFAGGPWPNNHVCHSEVQADLTSNYGLHVEIAAPFWANSTFPGGGYHVLCGTSMATPHVTGTVALMRSRNPNLNNAQIVQILLQNAVDVGIQGWDPFFGYGLLNTYAAVAATPPPAPPLSASIGGPSSVQPGQSWCMWTANVSGGAPPYTYQWSGVLSGNSSVVSGAVNISGYLDLIVTDSQGQQRAPSKYITSSWSAPDCLL